MVEDGNREALSGRMRRARTKGCQPLVADRFGARPDTDFHHDHLSYLALEMCFGEGFIEKHCWRAGVCKGLRPEKCSGCVEERFFTSRGFGGERGTAEGSG